jgi:hypothetical protein
LTNQRTLTKRITSVSIQTVTHGSVAHNFAFCIKTTCIWTRIFAFLVDASQMTRAFWVTDTFGFTIRWVAYHFR